MEIVSEKKNDISIFKLQGRLDSNTAPEFEEKILDKLFFTLVYLKTYPIFDVLATQFGDPFPNKRERTQFDYPF